MIRHRESTLALFFTAALLSHLALADAYDPPGTYYNNATGTGTTLKQQLNTIIKTGHTSIPYTDSTAPYTDVRTALQITDADPNNPGRILLVYNHASLNISGLTGPPPGWDAGKSWSREHTWPQSRGIVNTSQPDGSDLHALRPISPSLNSSRGNLNYGGAYGAQAFGIVTDGGNQMWYPGDADAGMIARSEFYMAVRYDGTDSNTTDLELVAGNPADNGTTLGDLNRLIQWHFAATPDTFERRRNQVIYDSYQHNRNPFIDHPEYVWSIFVNQTNNSQITIASPTTINTNTGSSTKTVNLGRVFVNSTVPAPQTFTLNKSGNDGTYFEVSTDTNGYSPSLGRFNAFRTGTSDTKSISVGLKSDTNTANAGTLTGTVTVDNLDITSGGCGGAGCGTNDVNDVFNVSLTVLDHAIPSFTSPSLTTSATLDFGNIALGSGASPLNFSVFNLEAPSGSTAALDLDSISGSSSAFTTNLATFSNQAAGSSHPFTASFIATTVGTFEQMYTLTLSDEDLTGAQTFVRTLTLKGKLRLAGDFNGDGIVNSGDYLAWRRTFGQSVTNAYDGADGNGNGTIDDADFAVWRQHFGETASSFGPGLDFAAVPEPTTLWLAMASALLISCRRVRSA